MTTPLRALALVCSLKPSPADSSSDLLASQVLAALAEHGATGEAVRVVDHDVKPGVETDMGDGDAWPALREKVLAADVLVIATPTWMGQASSVCMRVLERLDAELSEKDDRDGRRCSARSRWRPSSATRTGRTTSARSCSRRSTTSGSASRRRA